MLKRSFLPYFIGIIAICIVMILFVSRVKERQALIEKAILESEMQHELTHNHTNAHGENDQIDSFESLSPMIDKNTLPEQARRRREHLELVGW